MSSRALNPRLVLPVVLAGTFMAILDVLIVVAAIPSIRADLRADYGAAEFVISAYTLTYASLLVTGGRMEDRFCRRRMFITGLLGFTGSSALCGAAPSIGVLIGARAVQGIGGALMSPQVLAIIQVTFDGTPSSKLWPWCAARRDCHVPSPGRKAHDLPSMARLDNEGQR